MKTQCILWLATLAALPFLLAQPAYMNYQGRLTDDQGRPLVNGLYDVHFRIYDAASGGNLVWGPFSCDGGTDLGHRAKATLVDGRFNVILGPADTEGRSLTIAFQGPNRFVEIRVGAGPAILPRQQFLSAPYALQSTRAQVADIATNLIQSLLDDLVPAGTIVAFGGPTNLVPRGWLWCDGRHLTNIHYRRLYAAIGTAWGNGTYDRSFQTNHHPQPPGTFNLLDLHGVFLRGVHADQTVSDRWGDPDAGNRIGSRWGANQGNQVGTMQTNQIQTHTHSYNTFEWTGTDVRLFDTDDSAGAYAPRTTGAMGGLETRPKNAYVNYIIKY